MKNTEITFKIKTIMFKNNDTNYTIIKGLILKNNTSNNNINNEMTIKGYFPIIYKGDTFSGIGEVLLDKTRGYYIELTDIPNIIIPENKKSLADFISKRVKGLTPKKGLEIVEILGLQTLSIIKRDYTMLMKIDGINEKKAKKIHEQLIKHESFEQFALFLQGLGAGIQIKLAVKIYDRYEEDSISIIKTNPYCITFDYDIKFGEADKIAVALDLKGDNENRLTAGILDYISHRAVNRGDLCVYQESILNELNDHLNAYGCFKNTNYSKDEILVAINNLALKKSITIETYKSEIYVYKNSNHKIGNNIVKNLKNILNNDITPFCLKKQIDLFINDYESKYFELDIKQKEAVHMALLNNISILTGGPGTGKTQTTNTIVKCIQHINPIATIMLLAPTGKASNRITELTNMEASTIHRGIKLTPFNKNDILEEITADFIIVDESSMIDAYIFEKLTSVIGEDTRVLFVGDVEQLPSVGAGLILKNLIDSERIATTKLNKIFRQAESSKIVTNAHKIIKGLTTKDTNGIDINNTIGSDFVFWKENEILKIRNNIFSSIDKLMSNYSMDFKDICILSPMRKGGLGINELNRLLQDRYNKSAPTKTEYINNKSNIFRAGDRVMQNKNNYELQVYNGDVGIITGIYTEIENGVEEQKIKIEYPDKDVVYKENEFNELELAYAMTIHKSQGSEFPGVIIPIHSSQKNMLYRNLIYTGITRAKKMCILIGEEESFNIAINSIDNNNRISLLTEKIGNIPYKTNNLDCVP